MECCVNHGLPIKCLLEKLDSKTESQRNQTHVLITTVLSKECHNQKDILKECKQECIAKKKRSSGSETKDEKSGMGIERFNTFKETDKEMDKNSRLGEVMAKRVQFQGKDEKTKTGNTDI